MKYWAHNIMTIYKPKMPVKWRRILNTPYAAKSKSLRIGWQRGTSNVEPVGNISDNCLTHHMLPSSEIGRAECNRNEFTRIHEREFRTVQIICFRHVQLVSVSNLATDLTGSYCVTCQIMKCPAHKTTLKWSLVASTCTKPLLPTALPTDLL